MGYLEGVSFAFRPIRQNPPSNRGFVLALGGRSRFEPDVHGLWDAEPEVFERDAHACAPSCAETVCAGIDAGYTSGFSSWRETPNSALTAGAHLGVT